MDWDICVVKSAVTGAPPDPDFDKYFASSGFFRVHQREEIDAFVPDTNDMFFDGIDPLGMSMLDLHIPDSTPTITMVWVIARSR